MGTPPPGQDQQSAVKEQQGNEVELGASVNAIRWTLATRIGFRFCFTYLLLFILTSGVFELLSHSVVNVFASGLGRRWPLREITLWTAAHVLHVTATLHPTGAGDTAFDWVGTFCILLIAAAATAVWSLFDRHRKNYVTPHKWFRLFLRFALAALMFFYASIKIFPLQMPYPPLEKLVEPYGNFSPMSVLWFSVGAAPVYEIFTGCAELLGGLLLILPVTTTLGALVCSADLTMIFVLNMSYDVAVKLFSFHLLLIALFLVAPDLRRLIGFFIANRSTPPCTQPRLMRTARANRIALAIQLMFGLYLAIMNLNTGRLNWYKSRGGSPKPSLYGIWNVDEMTIDGQLHPPLLTDAQRWHRMLFESNRDVEIQGMDDSFLYLTSSQKTTHLNLKDAGFAPALGYSGRAGLSGDFAVARPAPDQMTLDGSMGGHHIHAEMKRINLSQFTLVNRGFHWINEYPFWR